MGQRIAVTGRGPSMSTLAPHRHSTLLSTTASVHLDRVRGNRIAMKRQRLKRRTIKEHLGGTWRSVSAERALEPCARVHCPPPLMALPSLGCCQR